MMATIGQTGALGWGVLAVAATGLSLPLPLVLTLVALAVFSQLIAWTVISPGKRRTH